MPAAAINFAGPAPEERAVGRVRCASRRVRAARWPAATGDLARKQGTAGLVKSLRLETANANMHAGCSQETDQLYNRVLLKGPGTPCALRRSDAPARLKAARRRYRGSVEG